MNNSVIHIVDGSLNLILNVTDIAYVKADGNYCSIYLKRLKCYQNIRIQIGQMMKKIDELQVSHHLVRIDRSTIISTDLIEFIDPRKSEITLCYEQNSVILHVAKTAIFFLKDKISELINERPKSEGLTVVNRHLLHTQKQNLQEYSGHKFVDLGLTSHTMWASEDMAEFGPLGPKLFKSPYQEIENTAPKGSFESFLQIDEDAAKVLWGKQQNRSWRLPTVKEWKELFEECQSEWLITSDLEIVCVLTGKNSNQIYFKSLYKQRGFCSYWTANGVAIQGIFNYDPHNCSIEFMEPYGKESWYHFVSNYDSPQCNIRPVISSDDIIEK